MQSEHGTKSTKQITHAQCYIQVPTEGDNEEPVKPFIVLQTFKKYGDPLALSRTLQTIKPQFVIMYDADMTAVRRLEVRICCEVYCDHI